MCWKAICFKFESYILSSYPYLQNLSPVGVANWSTCEGKCSPLDTEQKLTTIKTTPDTKSEASKYFCRHRMRRNTRWSHIAGICWRILSISWSLMAFFSLSSSNLTLMLIKLSVSWKSSAISVLMYLYNTSIIHLEITSASLFEKEIADFFGDWETSAPTFFEKGPARVKTKLVLMYWPQLFSFSSGKASSLTSVWLKWLKGEWAIPKVNQLWIRPHWSLLLTC